MSDEEFKVGLANARDGETIDRQRNLQGQAPFLINVGLDYNNQDIGFKPDCFIMYKEKHLKLLVLVLFQMFIQSLLKV